MSLFFAFRPRQPRTRKLRQPRIRQPHQRPAAVVGQSRPAPGVVQLRFLYLFLPLSFMSFSMEGRFLWTPDVPLRLRPVSWSADMRRTIQHSLYMLSCARHFLSRRFSPVCSCCLVVPISCRDVSRRSYDTSKCATHWSSRRSHDTRKCATPWSSPQPSPRPPRRRSSVVFGSASRRAGLS